MNGPPDFEGAFLEHHDGGVVDASSFGEDEDRQFVLVLDVLSESAADGHPVVGRGSLEPNMIRCPMQGGLQDAQEADMLLTNHRVSVVAAQNNHVDRSSVIRHANA